MMNKIARILNLSLLMLFFLATVISVGANLNNVNGFTVGVNNKKTEVTSKPFANPEAKPRDFVYFHN